MKKISNFFKFVFVYKALKDVQAHATKGQVFLYWMRNGVRRALMLAIFAAVATVPAYAYHEMYPKIAMAEPVIKEVPAEQRLSDFPILVKICKAESAGKQFKANGNVVRGIVDPSDIGICQIHETLWNDKARKMGYDIFTEKGNEDMAIWLFVNYGTEPWNSSKATWSRM